VRDYVHVVDIADAHVRALEIPLDGDKGRAPVPVAMNLGTGGGHSVQEVITAAQRVTGKTLKTSLQPRRPGDPPELVAAVDRAAAVLGWRASRSSLDEILESAWRWHRQHPQGYRGGRGGGA
jgi:UDP-glucose 4-epimerase